ncbi:MAG: hypothetical protein J2P15_05680 [Micromonosporaceae bacterium]|nr:hypothetical protein [Micromonosporaceae bacterium]
MARSTWPGVQPPPVPARRHSRGAALLAALTTIALIIAVLLLLARGGSAGRIASALLGLGYLGQLGAIAARDHRRRQLYLLTQAPPAQALPHLAAADDARARLVDLGAPTASERRWERRQSWWIALLLPPFGFNTVAAFGYIAMRGRSWTWALSALGYAALTGVWLTAEQPEHRSGTAVAVGTGCWLLMWLGGLGHGLLVRRAYLAALAGRLATGTSASLKAQLRSEYDGHLAAAISARRGRPEYPPLRGGGFTGLFSGLVLRMGVLGLGAALLAVVFIPITVVRGVAEAHFQKVAVAASAVVVDRNAAGRGGTSAKVAFQAADGRTITTTVGVQGWPQLGSAVRIRYDPQNPGNAEAANGGRGDELPFSIGLILAAAALAGASWLWNHRRG